MDQPAKFWPAIYSLDELSPAYRAKYQAALTAFVETVHAIFQEAWQQDSEIAQEQITEDVFALLDGTPGLDAVEIAT